MRKRRENGGALGRKRAQFLSRTQGLCLGSRDEGLAGSSEVPAGPKFVMSE